MFAQYAGEMSPTQAWTELVGNPSARLIDVRTAAEWVYVGLPDLGALEKQPILVSWLLFPTMARNEDFAAQLTGQGIRPDHTLLFICRSGVRSKAAAELMTGLGFSRCWNVSDGFEGQLDPARRRVGLGGWKASGLPWVQS